MSYEKIIFISLDDGCGRFIAVRMSEGRECVTGAGSVIYYIDLFSTLPEDEDNPLPASGTYTLTDDEDFPPYTINGGMTYPSFASGTVYLDDITLEIGYEGNNIVLDAVILDKNGESHHVTYSGLVVFSVDI